MKVGDKKKGRNAKIINSTQTFSIILQGHYNTL